MNFEELRADDGLNIDAYNNQQIEISGKSYPLPILLGHGIHTELPSTPDGLNNNDVQAAYEAGVEIMLIGTGSKQQFIPIELRVQAANLGIGIECMTTAAACRTYTLLHGEGRKVWAWLW